MKDIKPVAWLYHDAESLEALREPLAPLIHSTLLTFDRRPHARNETPLYAAADVAALVRQLRDALAECVDDSRAAADDHERTSGQIRQARTAGLRKIVSDADAAIAAANAFMAQQEAQG